MSQAPARNQPSNTSPRSTRYCIMDFRFVSLFLLGLLAVALPSVAAPSSRVSCSTPSTITFNDDRLPDPFIFNDGTPVRTLDDWSCRRAQIGALIQGYEAGWLPPKPEHVSSTFSMVNGTGNLTVTAGFPGSLVSFWSGITYPSGTAPSGGWPLLIAYDGAAIPVPDGIAVMVYVNDNLAQQNNLSSRGVGLFYDVYGVNATASSMMAWVWGLGRIIDSLEVTPQANINLAKLAVTGCSRDGKGALMAGAFEERIALTIPQESGSGGDTCWRLSKFEQDSGDVVQQATEIVQENVWLSTNFANYVYNLSVLPYDHHHLAGMIAPRALLSFENTELVWLSPLSAYGCMTAAHSIWEAMGVPHNHGFVQAGNHSHCVFPGYLNASVFAFLDNFLLDKPAVTNIFYTNGEFNGTVFDPSYWINWTTPSLT